MLNQCNFIGRLGKEPESSFTTSGKQVAKFSLAVSEKRGGEEATEWVSVICWEKTAKFVCDFMHKGNLAFVSGRMSTRKWQNKEGKDQYTTEIIAATVQNLTPRDSQREGPSDTNSDMGEVPF